VPWVYFLHLKRVLRPHRKLSIKGKGFLNKLKENAGRKWLIENKRKTGVYPAKNK
jgi:hypothetical protein